MWWAAAAGPPWSVVGKQPPRVQNLEILLDQPNFRGEIIRDLLFIFSRLLFGRAETKDGGPCGHRGGSASHKQPNMGGPEGPLEVGLLF